MDATLMTFPVFEHACKVLLEESRLRERKPKVFRLGKLQQRTLTIAGVTSTFVSITGIPVLFVEAEDIIQLESYQ